MTAARQGNRRILIAVDRAARRLGLRPGIAVAEAQARVPGLTVVEAKSAEDEAALEALAAWCIAFTPLAAPAPLDGVWLDVAGSTHLFGGEAALIDTLVARIERQAVSVKAAIADTPGAAWAVARFAPRRPDRVVASGGAAAAIAELPVRSLRLATPILDGLSELGIARVGQLAALPRAPLRLRFGEEVIRRLDQAMGHAPEPLEYIDLPETPLARLAFAEPISAPETLERVAVQLVAKLCTTLESRSLGARTLDLVFVRVDRQRQAVRIGTAKPTREPRHLLRLLGDRLALIDPGHGIDEAILFASRVERLNARQVAVLGEENSTDGVAELVDRLVARLGPQRVFRIAPVESEMPERSIRRVPPLEPATGATWPAHLPRPARLLEPPEEVHAIAVAPDHPPIFFVWRKVRYRVTRADGPEQVFGEWWARDDEISSTRDYYAVEDETGARFWLFRDAPVAAGGRWWLHGIGLA